MTCPTEMTRPTAPTRPTEDALIARYFAPLAVAAGADGLADDAAVIPEAPGHLIVTKDMAVAGVHFFPDDPPAAIAAKALRVNLSDLAAKGAAPVGFLLGLGLPPDWDEALVAGLAAGLKADSDTYGCALYGGDTVAMPGPLTLSVTAFGRAPRRVLRRGARAGDVICVTGTIGDAALGLKLRQGDGLGLSSAEAETLLARYLLPQPRCALAAAVAAHASAAMDVSDGLAGDLAKLLAASGVAGHIAAGQVPLSAAARAALAQTPHLLRTILTGGDDYEILLTCPPAALDALRAAGAAAAIPVTPIGRIAAGTGLAVLDVAGAPLDLGSGRYEHFRTPEPL